MFVCIYQKKYESVSYPVVSDSLPCSPCGTVDHQAPLSLEFPRQEYWSGLPFPSPGGLPNTGIKPGSPTLQTDTLLFEQTGALSNPPKNTIKILSIHSTSTLF